MLSPRQFAPPGDEDAKAALLKQLKGNFSKQDLAWLKDPAVRVEAPQRVDPSRVNTCDYPEWRASRQLKAVQKVAKKIDKGKDKPSVMAQCPSSDQLDVIDGHHHYLGYVDHKEDPLAFIVHVPSRHGPWAVLHDHQRGDKKKDDFGKTDKSDRND